MYRIHGGDPKLVRSTVYCPPCYDLFEKLALVETPDLMDDPVNAAAAIGQLDNLLHLSKGVYRREQTRKPNGPASVLMFPVDLIIDQLPFKRYYLSGDELARHAAKARALMCVELADTHHG